MKVMHILNTGTYSGAENVAISIINHMKKDTQCVYVSLKGSIEKILKENNINYYLVDKLTFFNVKKAIRDEQPDIIHAHDFTASIVSSVVANNIPIISHLHNNPPWIKKINLKTIIYGISCLKYKRILTVSDSIMKEYIFGSKFYKKSMIIGNPIISKDIIKRSKIALKKDSYDIVYLGRFTLQKDPEKFLTIIKKLTERIPNLKVGMIGTGEMYEFIKEKIVKMKLENIVTCPGFIENPYGILSNSKLLCIPSKWEGFGLVAVEALSLGKPVVASNVGGLPKIVTNDSGRICNTLNDFIDEIYILLTNPEYYHKKSNGAKKRADFLSNEYTYFKRIKEAYMIRN